MNNPYSSIKVFHHHEALKAMAQGEHIAPIYIRLKPTNLCNHHCIYCSYGSGNTQEAAANRDNVNHKAIIPWEKLQEIINDMGLMGVRAVTFSGGGEPLTHPYIREAASMITQRGIDLSLITNGELLTGETAAAFYSAKWVRVSFDAPTPSMYSRLRGVSTNSFHQVVQNLENFAKYKQSQCVLGVNFVIGKENAALVYEAARLIKSVGGNNIKFSAVKKNEIDYHRDIKDRVLAQIQQAQADLTSANFSVINKYVDEWPDQRMTETVLPQCYTVKLVTVIAADLHVYACHQRAYDSQAIIGDLQQQSFRNMWFSPEVKQRLSTIQPQRDCQNFCVYRGRNKMLSDYFAVDAEQVNFI